MKKLIFLFLGILAFQNAFSQEINLELKQELKDIFFWDQVYRSKLLSNPTEIENVKEQFFKKGYKLDSFPNLFELDSLNLISIDRIIKKHGYPGKSLVGEPENSVAWLVIQHSDEIKKYIKMIRKEGKKGEIDKTLVAMMEDRHLLHKERRQIYGTQGQQSIIEENGKKYEIKYVWPIRNPKKVDKMRKEIGFKDSVEENARQFFGKSFIYKNYSFRDIKKGRIEKEEIKIDEVNN